MTDKYRLTSYVGISFIFFSIVYVFTLLFIGAYFSYPNAEDLGLAARSREFGVLGGASSLLNTFDGRYFTNILHGLNPLAFNWYYGYKIVPVFSVLLLFSSTMFFIYSLLSSYLDFKKIALISCGLVIAHFSTIPSLPHQLYWMVSSFVYLFPWITLFFWTGSYIQFYKTKKNIWFFLALFFLILAMGLNEMFLLFNLFIALVVLIHGFYSNNHRKEGLMVFSMAILSAFFFVSHYGIAKRYMGLSDARQEFELLDLFIVTGGYNMKMLFQWLTHPVFLVCSFFNVMLLRKVKFVIPYVFFYLLAAIIVFYLMTLIFYIPMGYTYFEVRLYNSLQPGIFILFTLMIYFIFNGYINKNLPSSQYPFLFFMLSILLFTSLLVSDNSVNLIKNDFKTGKLTSFKSVMDDNYDRLTRIELQDACWRSVELFDVLNFVPNSIAQEPFLYSNRNPHYWNRAYEEYFKVDEVYLEGDSVTKGQMLIQNWDL
jgi:hypothetical protein